MTTTTYEVERVELRAQPAAVVRGHSDTAGIPAVLGGAFRDVMQVLQAQGLWPAGPPFARYEPAGDGFDITAGFPTQGAFEPGGDVVACELPAGPAVQVLHRGDYAAVAAAYDVLTAWVAEHGYVPAGAPWESYLDGPEAPEPRTVVVLPFRDA